MYKGPGRNGCASNECTHRTEVLTDFLNEISKRFATLESRSFEGSGRLLRACTAHPHRVADTRRRRIALFRWKAST